MQGLSPSVSARQLREQAARFGRVLSAYVEGDKAGGSAG